MIADEKDEHPKKQYFPVLITEFGIPIDDKDKQLEK
jgi:hypothetical protein